MTLVYRNRDIRNGRTLGVDLTSPEVFLTLDRVETVAFAFDDERGGDRMREFS